MAVDVLSSECAVFGDFGGCWSCLTFPGGVGTLIALLSGLKAQFQGSIGFEWIVLGFKGDVLRFY